MQATTRVCSEASADTDTGLIAYSDTSYGRTPYPFQGGVVMWRNGAIAWFARKAKQVFDGTCMAELAALNTVLKETLFAHNNLSETSRTRRVTVPKIIMPNGNTVYDELGVPHLICDGKSTLDVIRHSGATKRSAHYDIWLYFARDAHLSNKAKFFHTTTDKMMADNMTKQGRGPDEVLPEPQLPDEHHLDRSDRLQH